MDNSYEKIGLDSKLRSINSLVSRAKYVPAMDFDNEYEVRSGKLNASKVNLGQFIKRSSGGSVLGTFSSSQALNLTSTITYDTPKKANKTFGAPIVGIYEGAGTASADQIYPIRGANVTLGRYDVVGGVCNYTTYNGTAINWSAMIIDSNGTSTQSITFVADWLFTDYVTDDVS